MTSLRRRRCPRVLDMGTTYQDKALHWELDQWLVTNLVKCFSSTTFFGDQIVCTWDRMGMFFPTASWNVKLTETHRYFETFCNKTHQQNTYFQSSVAQKSTTESYCFSSMSIKLSACDSWCVSSTPSVLVLSCIHESKRLVSTCFQTKHMLQVTTFLTHHGMKIGKCLKSSNNA